MTTESIDRPTVPANRPVDREDVVRRALSELRSAKSEVAESRARSSEPVAVVGVGCRFPGGVVGVESFWDLLVSGG
ncbi:MULTISPECIES: beta-ketoacyl synthase N-terminal-like domain-containing protein, partial [Nocardiaceae]|uniref:beta-ketoacyl synthase N-terminal-like domain-containing protein n=1 Tax=Nocardiaceae TaxID=85025 RepID=UPI0034234ABF